MTGEGITQMLADSVVEVTFDALPESVVHQTKRIVLDSVGCALGGWVVDKARIPIEFVDDLGGKPQATIIGNGRTSYTLAAFANGELINALDYDVAGPLTPHVVPQVIAPSLSMAERVEASGKDLITAIALGIEVGGRVASSISGSNVRKEEPPYYEEAPRFSFTATIFGAVASACKILGLNAIQIANAFGIAGASTPVPAGTKWRHTGGPSTMLKYNCWLGWIAQLATTAALVAEKGFTGDRTILDGDWGFWRIYGSPFFKPDNIIDHLGKVWHLDTVIFKVYPTCWLNSPFIEGINKIMQENEVKPDDIERIVIKGDSFLLTPSRAGNEVYGFAEVQFNVACVAALVVYYGAKPNPGWQIASTFTDRRIKDLMRKVKVEIHPEAERLQAAAFKAGLIPNFFDTIVEITARGRRFLAEVTTPKGLPANPQTDDELKEKFRNNSCYSPLRSDKVEQAIRVIYELEDVVDIKELTNLLTTKG